MDAAGSRRLGRFGDAFYRGVGRTWVDQMRALVRPDRGRRAHVLQNTHGAEIVDLVLRRIAADGVSAPVHRTDPLFTGLFTGFLAELFTGLFTGFFTGFFTELFTDVFMDPRTISNSSGAPIDR